MKSIECEACGMRFIEGTGHKCYCPDCKKPHEICEGCYQEAKANGNIRDRKINIGQLDNPERYT